MFQAAKQAVKPQMFEHTAEVLAEAERATSLDAALTILRRLGLDDFGLLMLSLPNPAFPSLSRILPRMASESVQKEWTGTSGVELLKTSIAFMRVLESASIRHTGKSIQGRRVLDFGCGYGRLVRLLYYYTGPENIYAADAWDTSLSYLRNDGVIANVIQTPDLPQTIDCQVDIAYSFSVLTHTSRDATQAILRAVRTAVPKGGLFIATIRPIEIWERQDRPAKLVAELKQAHRENGYAFVPDKTNEHYGDTSMKPAILGTKDWRILSVERSLADPVQLVVSMVAA